MSQTETRSTVHAFWKGIFSRFCLLILILCALGCLTEGRPRTLKKCGRRNSPVGKIINGKNAQPGDYPWMVSIHQKSRYRFRHYCGGTILNEHYILTAAHCFDVSRKPSMYEIYTGLHQISKKHRKPTKKYKVSQVIVHENYSTDGYFYDIALLRTKEPIQFEGTSSGYVNGICLPQNNEDPTGWATITGWGDTEHGGDSPDTLLTVKVPLVSRKDCNFAYDVVPAGYEDSDDDTYDIIDSQICAGIINRDSCQGDSGGPLVQSDKRGIFTQIGVVSYGFGCGLKNYPGVYTKVAFFMDWLEKNMD